MSDGLRDQLLEATPPWTPLREMRLLSQAADFSLEEIWRHIQVRETPVGLVMRHDIPTRRMISFVADGLFRISLRTPAGEGIVMRLAGKGAHFGEVSSAARNPQSNYVVRVLEPGLLYQIQADEFFRIAHSTPEISSALTADLANQILERNTRLHSLATLDAPGRLAAEILRLSKEPSHCIDGFHIIRAPTHQEIAVQIGASRPHVTRHLLHLEKKRLIAVSRAKITILDLAGLERLARVQDQHDSGAVVE